MIRKMILACVVLLGSASVAVLAEDGATIYGAKCALCHGKDGKGQTKMGEKFGIKDLTDAKYQATFTDEQLLKTLKEGMKVDDKVKMKAYDSILSAEELKAVVAHVRTFVKK